MIINQKINMILILSSLWIKSTKFDSLLMIICFDFLKLRIYMYLD